MDKKRNRMIKKYLLYVLGTGVILLLLCPWRVEAITGLAVSAATVTCNFKLLEYAIMNCTNGKKVLQLPGILIFRLLLYIGAAYFCVKIDYTSVITYAVGVIELTFAAVTEYGKGEKND